MAKEEKNNVHTVPGINGSEEGAKKVSYEQLAMYAQQASAENQKLTQLVNQLQKQLTAFQMQDFYQRLEWLWRVITSDKNIFSDKFVKERIEEFEMLMTPVEEEKEK